MDITNIKKANEILDEISEIEQDLSYNKCTMKHSKDLERRKSNIYFSCSASGYAHTLCLDKNILTEAIKQYEFKCNAEIEELKKQIEAL